MKKSKSENLNKSVYDRIRKPTAPPTKVIQSQKEKLREREDRKAMEEAEWEVNS